MQECWEAMFVELRSEAEIDLGSRCFWNNVGLGATLNLADVHSGITQDEIAELAESWTVFASLRMALSPKCGDAPCAALPVALSSTQ